MSRSLGSVKGEREGEGEGKEGDRRWRGCSREGREYTIHFILCD